MPQAYCCWAYNFSGKEYHVRYNNHSDPGTLDPQKVEENTAAQIVLDLF